MLRPAEPGDAGEALEAALRWSSSRLLATQAVTRDAKEALEHFYIYGFITRRRLGVLILWLAHLLFLY